MELNSEDILVELRQFRNQLEDPEDSIWREHPVLLREFVESPEYCNLPSLTPIQYRDAVAVLGDDPKKMFDVKENNGINIAVLLWGKGSGKDYLTSIIQLYCIYVILCLREPQIYFNQAPGEPLDVINVAYSGEQARNVYFTKFLERLKRCKWFSTHFNIFQSGRLVAKRNPNALGNIQIGASMVTFPHNVRAISESSENESYEGYNIIVWIMDEASAFKSLKRIENAGSIYNTLKTSANTRFANRWKGFVLSYPRAEEDWDFTIKLFKESKLPTSTNMYSSRHASWEVAPKSLYPGGTFKFRYEVGEQAIELDVPTCLREEFEKFPEKSLSTYCCIPVRAEGAFIEAPGIISKVFSDREPIFLVESIILETDSSSGTPFRSLGYRIVKWNQLLFDKSKRYVAHIDCGLSQDRAALVVAHGEYSLVEMLYSDGHTEKHWVQKVVEDAHVVYEPDPKSNLRVSLNNIADLLLDIAAVVPLAAVTFDHWQSASLVETLTFKGLSVKEHNINRDDYELLKSLIYTGDIDLLRSDLTEKELYQLRRVGGNIDHPQGGSKDLADCLAGVVRLLVGNTRVTEPKGEIKSVPVIAPAYTHSPTDFKVGPSTGVVGKPKTTNISPKLPEIPSLDSFRRQDYPSARTFTNQSSYARNGKIYSPRIKELR